MSAALPPALEAALARRAPLLSRPDTDALRLIHRAADGFPPLAVDAFGPVLVASLYDRRPLTREHARLLGALAERRGAAAVYVKYRPVQASTLSAADRAALAPAAPLLGRPLDEVEVRENGLRFLIRPAAGLSVGLFLDMREMRAWVREQAAGRTVLNLFAYTCGFGVAAAAGGAARVVNVDAARSVLAWGRANYALNGLAAEEQDFIFGDAFDWLKRFARRGQTFDLVILDPPSYATTKTSRFAVSRDYAALAALAAPLVAPGGWLLACANAAELPQRAFVKQLRAGLGDRPARLTFAHEPPLDFPLAPGQTPYLKIGQAHLAR
ncbi:MAG: class I SAM-dependent rRNA methyltransferase [Anaerolineales bacterium]|nr:class I SAM-dependent rRNA methyltransferase [Anaerolineales bacterium]